MTALAPTLEAFFTDRLLCQQRVSPNTIASYRDTFRLLLGFAQQQTGRSPDRLELTQLDATMTGAFLEHLETDRGNSPRTRNVRLGAIHRVLQLLRAQTPRARRLDRTGARDPRQTPREADRHVPDPRGGQSAPGQPRPIDLGRTTRPRAAALRRADRAARLGAHRAGQRRRATRHRTAPSDLGQGPQRTRRAAHQPNRRGAQDLDARARRPARRPAVSHPDRQAAQPPRSSGASPSTSPPHSPAARRCARSESRCTCCATPRR